eukprot:s3067_g2.t1
MVPSAGSTCQNIQAGRMLQGKMSLKDYGKAAKTWAFLYSLFTCSTGARLSRAKDTQLSPRGYEFEAAGRRCYAIELAAFTGELPRPMSSIVDPAWLQRADHKGGLCPRLLFVPELSREGGVALPKSETHLPVKAVAQPRDRPVPL